LTSGCVRGWGPPVPDSWICSTNEHSSRWRDRNPRVGTLNRVEVPTLTRNDGVAHVDATTTTTTTTRRETMTTTVADVERASTMKKSSSLLDMQEKVRDLVRHVGGGGGRMVTDDDERRPMTDDDGRWTTNDRARTRRSLSETCDSRWVRRMRAKKSYTGSLGKCARAKCWPFSDRAGRGRRV